MDRKPYGLAKRGRRFKLDSLDIGESFFEEPLTMAKANALVQDFRFHCASEKRFRCVKLGEGVRIFRTDDSAKTTA